MEKTDSKITIVLNVSSESKVSVFWRLSTLIFDPPWPPPWRDRPPKVDLLRASSRVCTRLRFAFVFRNDFVGDFNAFELILETFSSVYGFLCFDVFGLGWGTLW